MACVLAERSRSASGFLDPCAHGRRRLVAPPHRRYRAAQIRMVAPGRSCTNIKGKVHPDEGMRSPDRAALIAQSDDAVTIGGAALDHATPSSAAEAEAA
eukprot:5928753-Pleurochrysis_carterae.AAC.3